MGSKDHDLLYAAVLAGYSSHRGQQRSGTIVQLNTDLEPKVQHTALHPLKQTPGQPVHSRCSFFTSHVPKACRVPEGPGKSDNTSNRPLSAAKRKILCCVHGEEPRDNTQHHCPPPLLFRGCQISQQPNSNRN